MEHRIIAIDQSTSATKALLFDEHCHMLDRTSVERVLELVEKYFPN